MTTRATSRLVPIFGAAVFLMAQTGQITPNHITPFTGTWKVNLAKSSFDPGPPFKSFTITFTPDGTRSLDAIGSDGKSLKASLPWSNGKQVPVTASQGMENATAISKIHGNAIEAVVTEVQQYSGNEQHDDITPIVAKRR